MLAAVPQYQNCGEQRPGTGGHRRLGNHDEKFLASSPLAEAQPTPARANRAVALICLGAGAGLTGADLRAVLGSDVVARSGGVVVLVAGRRPRAVPVLARFHHHLLAAAAFAPERPLVAAGPHCRNVTAGLSPRSPAGAGCLAWRPGGSGPPGSHKSPR